MILLRVVRCLRIRIKFVVLQYLEKKKEVENNDILLVNRNFNYDPYIWFELRLGSS